MTGFFAIVCALLVRLFRSSDPNMRGLKKKEEEKKGRGGGVGIFDLNLRSESCTY